MAAMAVDDPQDVHTTDHASILGSLALGVIEVSWNADDCIFDIRTEVGIICLLHLYDNH